MKLANPANNHFSVLHRKKAYCPPWAVCMWDICGSNLLHHHKKKRCLLNSPFLESQAQIDKIKLKVRIWTHFWIFHMFSMLLHFLVPCFPKPCLYPKSYIICYRLKIFQLIAYWKWIFHWNYFVVEPKKDLLEMWRPHFWCAFLPFQVQLAWGLD